MAGECPPLELGGRTPQEPCTGWLFCTWADFSATRAMLVLEHNALVNRLNAWNRLVAAGKATWTPIPTASWQLYEESWRLLQLYPVDKWNNLSDIAGNNLEAPVVSFIGMATRVHSAVCDMGGALAAINQPVPSDPSDPVDPKGGGEKALDFAREIGGGIIKLGFILAGSYVLVNLLGGKR